jgi:hypothetical protein
VTRIGRNPAMGSLRFILIVCVIVGFLLGSPLTRVTDGEVPYPVGVALSIALLIAVILGLTAILYRPLTWDQRAGTASFGGRTVPLASVTRVVRGISAGSGAAYLTYRFFSTEGPSVRVLIAGSPMKGLDAPAVAELIRFVEAAPITEPMRTGGLSDQQAAVADALTESGGKSEVGKRLLLEELRSIVAAQDTGATPGGASSGIAPSETAAASAPADPSAPPVPLVPLGAGDTEAARRPRMSNDEARALEEQWAEDDADAARYLRAHPTPFVTLRRVLVLSIVVAALVSVVALVVTVVAETTTGSRLDEDANDLAALWIVGPGLLGVALYIAWCIAADAQVGRLQTTANAWLQTRDPQQRTRGLAVPLLAAWAQPAPGTRTARALGFAGSTVGGLAFLIGVVLFFDDSEDFFGDGTGPLVATLFAVIGGAILVAGIVGLVWSYRRRRAGARELVLLAGWRLDPPLTTD